MVGFGVLVSLDRNSSGVTPNECAAGKLVMGLFLGFRLCPGVLAAMVPAARD